MKTYLEQVAEVKEILRRSPELDVIEIKEVIAENDERILIRAVGVYRAGDKCFPTLSHELWTDKAMYLKGVKHRLVGHPQHTYMINIAGADEQQLINDFLKDQPCKYQEAL